MKIRQNQMENGWNQGTRGFILVTSYLLLSVLSIFSLALFSRSAVFLQATERNQNKIIAFNMAESGVDTALVQLAANPAYTGTGGYTSMDSGSVNGGYQVTVTTPATTPTGQPNTNATIRQIVAQGYAPANTPTSAAYETRTVSGYVSLAPSSLFNYAVFADEDMKINGSPGDIIDSFNSNISGAYNPYTAGAKGDIGTNSIDKGDVSLIGNISVKGNAAVGPGGTADVVSLGPNVTLTGAISANPSPESFEPATATGTDLGSVSLSGSTQYELPAGTYQLDKLKITGTAKLVPLGPVKLYVKGDVDIGGNGVATSGDLAKNFLLYATTNAGVKISGGGKFYGGVYAPLSEVKSAGGATIFGAVVSKEYDQDGGSSLHFDEALKEIKGDSGNEVSVLSWAESNTSLGS